MAILKLYGGKRPLDYAIWAMLREYMSFLQTREYPFRMLQLLF